MRVATLSGTPLHPAQMMHFWACALLLLASARADDNNGWDCGWWSGSCTDSTGGPSLHFQISVSGDLTSGVTLPVRGTDKTALSHGAFNPLATLSPEILRATFASCRRGDW